MGRLKRTYNALVESDIAIEVHVTAQNGFEKDYSKLSDLMNDIITDKAEKADDLQGAVDDAKAKVKKLEKVIATLEDLTK
jgi:hypothetical protein